jgi:hypothetical protein
LQQAAFGTSLIWAVSPSPDLASLQQRTVALFWRGIAVHPEPISKHRAPKNYLAVRP